MIDLTSENNINYREHKDQEDADIIDVCAGRELMEISETESKGSRMDVPKKDSDLRFSCFNPRGLKRANVQFQIQIAADLDVNIQGFSKVNANFLNTTVRQAFWDKTGRVNKEGKLLWATSLVTSASEFKAGGTGLVTFGRLAPRVKEQRIMLSEENRDNRDPRKQFQKDLIDLIRKFKLKNGNIIPILMGDWNDDRGKKIFAAEAEKEFGLVDAYKQKFPDSEEFKTHIDGSKRIDYVFTLPWIADAMTNIVYEPFQYRLTGNHRGIYFDIDKEKLFCNQAEEIYNFSGRLLQSKHKKNADRYLKQLSKHIDENKIAEKLQEAFNRGPNHHIIKMLNRTFTTGCVSAEKKCRRVRQKNWMLKMHQLKSKIAVWSIFCSCH